MKRFFIIVCALAVLLPARVSAQSGAVSAAVGASAGVMDGVGAGLAVGLGDYLRVRVGYSVVPSSFIKEYAVEIPAWGSNPRTSTALTGSVRPSGSLLVDLHPGGGNLRFTAGAFFGSEDFITAYNTTPLPESYHKAGVSYYVDADKDDVTKFYRIQTDDEGILSASIRTGGVRPFVGIGFGSAVPETIVGATLDLGVEYVGGLDLRVDARNIKGEMENIPLTTAGVLQTIYDMRGSSSPESYDKYIDYVDRIRTVSVLPVLRLSIFIKLF